MTPPETALHEATTRNPLSVPTAADLVEQPVGYDASTPMARAVAEQLLARRQRQSQAPLPRPATTRVLAVANQKGGVGKTTTTVNLAAALALEGLRVLVIDLDPQGNASTALSVDHERGTPSSYEVLVEGTPLTDVAVPHPEIANLFVVPSTTDLAGAEIDLVSVVARETKLRKALHAHPLVGGTAEDRFDYVFLDCPPSLGLLTLNALTAAPELLVPIQAEYYALEGLRALLETVGLVTEYLNPGLVVSTFLLTMFDSRTKLASQVAAEVREYFGVKVLRTAIPRSVRISEAPSHGETVITHDPYSAGALSYREAARELARQVASADDGAGSSTDTPEESQP